MGYTPTTSNFTFYLVSVVVSGCAVPHVGGSSSFYHLEMVFGNVCRVSIAYGLMIRSTWCRQVICRNSDGGLLKVSLDTAARAGQSSPH